MSYSLIIPVYNEIHKLSLLFEKLNQLPKDIEVFIVDDGSTDGSADLINKNKHFLIINNKVNSGKGYSIVKGSKLASKENIILLDSDLEIDVNEIPKLIKSYEYSSSSALLGKRWDVKNLKIFSPNHFGNYLLTNIFNNLFNTEFNDVLCCVRIINTNLFKSLNIESNGFGIEIETIGKLTNLKIQAIEHKVKYKRRSYEDGKKIKIFHGFNILFRMIKVKFFQLS